MAIYQTSLGWDRLGRLREAGFTIDQMLMGYSMVARAQQLLQYSPDTVKNVLQRADLGYFGEAVRMYQKQYSAAGHLGSVVHTRKITGRRAQMVLTEYDESDTSKRVLEYVNLVLENLAGWKDILYDGLEGPVSGWMALEIEWYGTQPIALHYTAPEDWMWQPSQTSTFPGASYDVKAIPGGMPIGLLWRDKTGRWAPTPADKFVIFSPDQHLPIAQRGAMRACSPREARKLLVEFVYALYCEKFGIPPTYLKAEEAFINDDQKLGTLLKGLQLMGSDGFALIPTSIEMLNALPSAGGVAPHGEFIARMNSEQSKAMLGQTLTTDVENATGTQAVGVIHEGVKKDWADSDLDVCSSAIQTDLIEPIVRIGIGPGIPCPQFKAVLDDPEAQKQNLDMITGAVSIGIPVSITYAHQATGIPVPDPDEELLQSTEPTAVGEGEQDEQEDEAAADESATDGEPSDD